MFIDYLKHEETRVIELKFDDFQKVTKPKQKKGDPPPENTWDEYRYSVEYYGDDANATTLTTKLSSGDEHGWKFDAPESVHELIQSTGPKRGDQFLIKRGKKNEKPQYSVWVSLRGRWEEVKKSDGFDPNAIAQQSNQPAQPAPVADDDPDQRPVTERRNRPPDDEPIQAPWRAKGRRVIEFIATSTIAGLSAPELNGVSFTDQQVSGYQIAAASVYGGRFGDKWESVDPALLDGEIKHNLDYIAQHGMHPYFTDQQDDDPEVDPDDGPSEEPAKESKPQGRRRRTAARTPDTKTADKPAQQKPKPAPKGDRNRDEMPNLEGVTPDPMPDWRQTGSEPPPDELFAWWISEGLHPGDKDSYGRPVLYYDGLPV